MISTMRTHIDRSTTKLAFQFSLLALMLILCVAPYLLPAQAPAAPATQAASAPTQSTPPAAATTPNHAVPSWAYPGSPGHPQVAPPPDFHRSSTNFDTPIGVFDGQSDVGSAVVPGSASYDAATKQYTINSAGYNVWYTRDEFRFLWKKMSGDVSLAANIAFPT